jgi:antitoxin CcdA
MRTECALQERPMGYDQAAPKRAVNMTLNEDLVRRARGITPNLSETVETLLAAYVDDAETRATHREQQIAAHIAASDAFVAKYGTLADEFGTL